MEYIIERIRMKINNERCVGCGRCVEQCAADAIKWNTFTGKPIIDETCINCFICSAESQCPAMAIEQGE